MNGPFILFSHHRNSKKGQILRLSNILTMRKRDDSKLSRSWQNKQDKAKKRPHEQNERLNSNLEKNWQHIQEKRG